MAELTSRCEKIQLVDGREVPLTLNFKKLLWLRASGYEKAVNAAMKSINGKELDILEMPALFWCAYLCAVDKPELTEDEFISLLPWDLKETATLFNNLNSKQKV